MGQTLFSISSYLSHWLVKEDLYSLQSPYLFSLIKGLSEFKASQKKANLDIEQFRKKLLANDQNIQVRDLGAGSKKAGESIRKISDITRYSTSSRKFTQLFQYFCTQTPAKTVVELGTCMGISTRYLSKVTQGILHTFEGSEEILKIAQKGLEKPSVIFHLGDIQELLPNFIQREKSIDFALIDANHTYKATLESFSSLLPSLHSQSIVIIGDIYWSAEMQQAWKEILQHPRVKLSLDFYECGVLLFDYSGVKQHLILDY
ncbi:Methyltransferase domain-containing protein [Algoriphagus faecimaris]|uniref:Methyltransferase domain-containing protein n=1 Tax=Algoriphagus faecimaris TaxID=686796 RepID=A0A1G6SR13_9BACT|nr:Methyltransferase domain-containing protein [Algoriphagus faecimaris]